MAPTMRDMPFPLEVVLWSLPITSVKAVCNVAAMRAIFAGAVFINHERPSAMTADCLTAVPVLDHFRMGIPPFCSAGIGAKYPCLSARCLNQGHTAALASFRFGLCIRVRECTAQVISFAVGFHGVHRQPHQLSNLLIAIPLPTQRGNQTFL